MKLFSLLVVLLLWKSSYLRNFSTRFRFVDHYLATLEKLFSRSAYFAGQMGLLLNLFIAPILLSVVDRFLGPTIFRLIFETLVLFFMLGNLSVCSFEQTRPANLPESLDHTQFHQIPESFSLSNLRWVAPLFWYLLAGVFGLTLYWVFASLQQNRSAKWHAEVKTWLDTLAWIPARLLALAYAISGNFSAGIKIISDYLAAGIAYNDFVIRRTVLASIDSEKELGPQCTKLEKDSRWILLGMYAVLAILSWII